MLGVKAANEPGDENRRKKQENREKNHVDAYKYAWNTPFTFIII